MCVKMVDEGWLRLERQATLDSDRRSPWFRQTMREVWIAQDGGLLRALERCNKLYYALRIIKELERARDRGKISAAECLVEARKIATWAGVDLNE